MTFLKLYNAVHFHMRWGFEEFFGFCFSLKQMFSVILFNAVHKKMFF